MADMRAAASAGVGEAASGRVLAEVIGHIRAWNASSVAHRERLLRAALPIEVAGFVAHSNALEGVPTLSAADTLEMVTQTVKDCAPLAVHVAFNTYEAFRLARAFRLQRGVAGGDPANELLWHVPQVLSIHRVLLRGLHERAGRLRVNDARPSDRGELCAPAAAVKATVWSFFDVAGGRALRLFPVAGRVAAEEVLKGEGDILDEDEAVNTDECARLLAAAPPRPDVRDIDESALPLVVEHAAWLAAQFLEVHPFADGNGRLARILVDAMLARVHPVPVPLVPAGSSLDEARGRYIAALRELPPWGHEDGGAKVWATKAPQSLTDLMLESMLASWQRLACIQRSLFGGGDGPFLGVLVLSVRSHAEVRRARYERLGHHERPRLPSKAELAAEADALGLRLPAADTVLVAGSPVLMSHAPTGRPEEGWFQLGWLP